MTKHAFTIAWFAVAVLTASLWPTSSRAQAPKVFQQVGFDQQLDRQVPGSLTFRDHNGRTVTLDDYYGEKPIVLSLVYYECPMLCTLELNGLVRSLKTLEMSAGEDFTIVTISFDPSESPQLAAEKRERYLGEYQRASADDGWQFLTGDEDSIQQLCKAVGFRYVYDFERDEYAHASGIVVLTPGGRVSRYFFGIEYAPKDLRLGLVESSAGKIGSAADHLLLLCYGYDPANGKYGFLVMNALRLGGVATLLALGGFVGVMHYRDHQTRTAVNAHLGEKAARQEGS